MDQLFPVLYGVPVQHNLPPPALPLVVYSVLIPVRHKELSLKRILTLSIPADAVIRTCPKRAAVANHVDSFEEIGLPLAVFPHEKDIPRIQVEGLLR
jgi:hypothetical protein